MGDVLPVRRQCAWAIATFVLATLFHGAAHGEDSAPKPFADECFFGGAQRPAALKALEGKPAAALSIESWIGEEVVLQQCKGKVIVVDFWATWCGPCMAAIPHNVELVKTYGDKGLVFVGVHDSNSGWNKADAVVKDKAINYSVGVDKSGGPSVKDYAVQFWPTYVAIDRAGIIRAAGLVPNRVDEVVKALLAEAAPAAAESAAEGFAAEFYYGGTSRPRALKDLEGKPAPQLKAAEWIGKENSVDTNKQRVMVVTFVSPALKVSLAELEKMLPLEKELSTQGVVFVVVCDGRAAWEKMREYATAKSLTMPVMRDAVETRAGENGKSVPVSVTATAFGIRHYPVSVIVDRAGRVRAAGVRADKVKAVVESLLGEPQKEDGANTGADGN